MDLYINATKNVAYMQQKMYYFLLFFKKGIGIWFIDKATINL